MRNAWIWTGLLIAMGLLFSWTRRALGEDQQLTPGQVRAWLQAGAQVLDVRTPEEFRAEHLPGGINIPLDEITQKVPQRFPDKGQILLLHCRSGRRSSLATAQLRRLGYTNVVNLGSYAQAQRLLTQARHGPSSTNAPAASERFPGSPPPPR